jgi:hypothetical protein
MMVDLSGKKMMVDSFPFLGLFDVTLDGVNCIFSVNINRTNNFQMKKKGFLLSAGVVHGNCKTWQERNFLMTIALVKMRIPLVHPRRRMMKTLL